jgi:acyl-CoA synthetase (AMP-forming)/AMP-acid ligase II
MNFSTEKISTHSHTHTERERERRHTDTTFEMKIFRSRQPPVSAPTDIGLSQYVLGNGKDSKPALIDGHTGFTLTYGQLRTLVFTIGKNLSTKFDFKKGDVFGIMLPNMPMFAALLHGVVSIGGICTTINPTYTDMELKHQLHDSNARFVVTVEMFLPLLDHVVSSNKTNVEGIFLLTPPGMTKLPNIKAHVKLMSVHSELLSPPSDKTPVQVSIDPKRDIAFLPYSSGTTGLSKGVMLTHYNIMINIAQVSATSILYEDDVVLGLLPFFHIYGLTNIMNMALWAGSTVVTLMKFDLITMLELVQKYKISILILVPPVILALAKSPLVDNYDLSSCRDITSGAAPLPVAVAEEITKRLKGKVNLRIGYGMTESAPTLTVSLFGSKNYKSAGVLLSNTELKVVDVDTGRELGEGEEGELCFRGPQVMLGYLKNPEATKCTIKDGWLHTGDIGYYKDGEVYITDRLKELIKVKGFQVPPAELEAILHSYPAVADVAVIGIPNEQSGEVPKAFVVLKPYAKVTEKELIEYASRNVSHYKRIHKVEFVSEIPKSAAGKILRRVLKEKENVARTLKSKL